MTFSGYRDHRKVGQAKVNQVNDPNSAYLAQEPHWGLLDSLIGGTYEMRAKHRKYLPQEPRELDESYDNRLARSVCPPYFVRLERMLAGMLTRKPVRLNDTPDFIQEQLFDVDLLGNDLNIWTYEAARKLIRYGHVGVLVDAPSEGEGGRPYWVTYSPRDIIGFRTEKKEGREELIQLRLSEKIVEPDGLYGEKEVEQIRVLTPGAFEIHRKDKEKSDWVVVEEGKTSLNEIPFAVAYANRIGMLESRPPMEDIAELNLKAYQTQSDLDNMLHISAVPMLGFFGYPQSAEEVSAGPGEAICFPSEGRAEYIEPGGKAFDAQYKRIEQVAQQINELGLAAVLGQKLSAETAESKKIDRSQGDSTMMLIAQQMQDLIDNCLGFHAEYLGSAVSGSSYVNRDFLSSRLDSQEIGSLLGLYTAGTISKETLLTQLAEGEILGDEFDIEAELAETENAGLEGTMTAEKEKEEKEDKEED